jgi:outer membrane protein OmpA-like peptidoglycan-associated protein
MSDWRIPNGVMMRSALVGVVVLVGIGTTLIAGTAGLALDRPQASETFGKKFLDTGAAGMIARSQPSIDLKLAFEDQSADITPQTAAELMKLGNVLTSKDLKGNVYLIAAYTDAREDKELSQTLSEQRAAAVKAFLHDRFGIAADRLVTVGYGSSRLRNKDDPLAAENNRIEIINLGKNPGARKNARPAPPPSPTPQQ